jgi:hypothetical protein
MGEGRPRIRAACGGARSGFVRGRLVHEISLCLFSRRGNRNPGSCGDARQRRQRRMSQRLHGADGFALKEVARSAQSNNARNANSQAKRKRIVVAIRSC